MDTFVLRIWNPGSGAGDIATSPLGTRGTVHHVGTGRSGVFRSEAQLIELVAALRRQANEDRGSGSTQASTGNAGLPNDRPDSHPAFEEHQQ